MVSRCANPECTARFHYLHEGTVYRVLSDGRCHDDWQCDGPHIHYFWLCAACTPQFRLKHSKTEGVYLEPVGGGAHIPIEPPESAQADLRREHTVV